MYQRSGSLSATITTLVLRQARQGTAKKAGSVPATFSSDLFQRHFLARSCLWKASGSFFDEAKPSSGAVQLENIVAKSALSLALESAWKLIAERKRPATARRKNGPSPPALRQQRRAFAFPLLSTYCEREGSPPVPRLSLRAMLTAWQA